MLSFKELKRNYKKATPELTEYKLAILGDSATQLLHTAIGGYAKDKGFQLDIYEADFDQIEQEVLLTDSQLYTFNPDYIFIYFSSQKARYSARKNNNGSEWADFFLKKVKELVTVIQTNSKAKVIIANQNELTDGVFGNYSNKASHSFLYQQRKFNLELANCAIQNSDLFILDLQAIQSQLGVNAFFNAAQYINNSLTISLDALALVAHHVTQIVASISGRFKKCLILDLDNTTWGGIIGDDGVEGIQIGSLGIGKAFTELQLWAKQLKERGIILCICSKNTEEIAKHAFENHPDMVLRLEDIAVFKANWENKAQNIAEIQKILNIGFDSMVFLDDNPFERNLVRENLPEVTVPELPEDPAEYTSFVESLNLFETASFSKNDNKRTSQYQAEAKRVEVATSFKNQDEFLQNLQMEATVVGFDGFNTPRLAQLSQRSNQFNLRTVRYTEGDIKKIIENPNQFGFSFSLKDKFGDNGLISMIIAEKQENTLFIDTWIMSCRVLKRGMEHFVLNTIVEIARSNNCLKVIGEYLPTPKNALVKNHYKELGFKADQSKWVLDVTDFEDKKVFINKI